MYVNLKKKYLSSLYQNYLTYSETVNMYLLEHRYL